ncbi:hypothetical protein C2W59_00860 [Bacillus pumilus]|nr:hypothetical protein C2W59_00860 [Bacillus pumilus]
MCFFLNDWKNDWYLPYFWFRMKYKRLQFVRFKGGQAR